MLVVQRLLKSRIDDDAALGHLWWPPRTGQPSQPAPVLHGVALTALRGCLGLVYIWFGALKVADVSPAAALVVGTVPFPTPSWFVAAVGWFEVILGLWLIAGRFLKLTLPLLVAHMIGTFGVLVFLPQMAFDHGNPLMLTMTGEFVVKNLVLLTASIVVVTRRVT
ncbi:putative oxidoreductase [Kitasatospora sp. GAS204A]|uniref:DoxX family protein n=1 Tax=Kitasatospora sp. GAS206B TaxID=3156256 RepID=UPI00247CE325|nr:putative oxidoreductase [Kitasatospora sp. GAS204B]